MAINYYNAPTNSNKNRSVRDFEQASELPSTMIRHSNFHFKIVSVLRYSVSDRLYSEQDYAQPVENHAYLELTNSKVYSWLIMNSVFVRIVSSKDYANVSTMYTLEASFTPEQYILWEKRNMWEALQK